MIIRTFLVSLGLIIFLLGIILFPLPGPFGIPTMMIGMTIMLKASNKVKRIVLRLAHRNNHSSQIWLKMRRKHQRMRKP